MVKSSGSEKEEQLIYIDGKLSREDFEPLLDRLRHSDTKVVLTGFAPEQDYRRISPEKWDALISSGKARFLRRAIRRGKKT